ncbi:hypothetical protein [Candidatus Enterovibrio escicola]|uniref:hypothetical protein n=1 Tax=Candidatus Enterovibrio escicola TaxID=1927127 RepID=UPI001237EE05|nr:hypothetical protein [Candidatus Enterovibrio escacola]
MMVVLTLFSSPPQRLTPLSGDINHQKGAPMPTSSDSHSLINEAHLMIHGLSVLAGQQDGPLENFTGESLFFLLPSIDGKLVEVLQMMEGEH